MTDTTDTTENNYHIQFGAKVVTPILKAFGGIGGIGGIGVLFCVVHLKAPAD